jgi:hypothetical protein
LAASSSAIAIAQHRTEARDLNRIVPYSDKATGKTHYLTPAEPDASLSPTTGTFAITINISVLSKWPTGTKPTYTCGLFASAASVNLTTESYTEFDDEASTTTTISGTSGTCTFTLPYAWLLPPASATAANDFAVTYSVEATDGTTSQTLVLRSQSGPVISGTIPASGTTTKTINVVL